MNIVETTPTNKNFLSPLGFRFFVKKLPNVNFFVQKTNIPGISIANQPYQPTPFTKIPFAGDHVEYNEFNLAFRVDEDLNNYLEIHNWIKALGFPEDFKEYRNLATKETTSGDGLKSDATLIITTNGKTPQFECVFEDAFPTTLSDLSFDSTQNDVNYILANVQFRYTLYKISAL
jgi:hypothetical protein